MNRNNLDVIEESYQSDRSYDDSFPYRRLASAVLERAVVEYRECQQHWKKKLTYPQRNDCYLKLESIWGFLSSETIFHHFLSLDMNLIAENFLLFEDIVDGYTLVPIDESNRMAYAPMPNKNAE